MNRARFARLLTVTLTLLFAAALISGGPVLASDAGVLAGIVKSKATGEVLSDVTILIVETRASTRTRLDGTYVLGHPAGEYTMLVAKAGFETVNRKIAVAADQTGEFNFPLTPVLVEFGEEIVVLGSRKARTALETPVPVDVLTETEMQATGLTETSRMIQFLAPSFNFSTSTVSDGTDHTRPSTLRGLGPDQTLVLVNGKRRHNSALVHVNGSVGRGSAGVDLNAIPVTALASVEILRDGAAAQYGSDAIAGAINLQLKERTEVTEIDITAGQTSEGDGDTLTIGVNHGWVIRESGFFNVTGEFRDRGYTDRSGNDPRNQYDDSAGLDPRELTFDRNNHRYGDAELSNVHLFFNSSIPVSDRLSIYFFGGHAARDGESAGFYRRAVDDRTVPSIHPDGFLPLINTDITDNSLSVGARQLLPGDWVLDANLTYGANEFDFEITNSNNVSLGPNSPTSAEAGTLTFGQATLGFDFFGSANWGLSKPVSIALGVELRQDQYEIEAGEEASWCGGDPALTPDVACSGPYFTNQSGGDSALGIQVFPGFRPGNAVDEDRTNTAVYGDIELDIGEKTLLGFAARFEDYSDFGSNLSGKIAARYAFTPRVAARGSISTGFRAPSLHQSFFNNTTTQFVLGLPSEVATFKNDDPAVRALGVGPLEEETSAGASLGMTAKPLDRLSITADVFRIDIDDRIVISGEFEPEDPASCINPGDCPIRDVLEPLGVGKAQFWANAIDTETTGADLVIQYTQPFGSKRSLSITGAANWNHTKVTGEVRTPPQLAGQRDTLFNRTERERIEAAQPRNLENLAFNYRDGRFSGLIRFNRFGTVRVADDADDPSLDQDFGSKILTDLDLSYKFRTGFRIAIGGNNIFDVTPDRNREELSFEGIFTYSRRTAPFGFNGAYYYTRATFEF